MSDSNDFSTDNAGLSSTVTGEITVAVVVVIFMVFAVTLVLYLRAKGYSGTMGSYMSNSSRRLVFAPAHPNTAKQALDPSVLNTLPVTIFRPEDFEEAGGLECAVCLSELRDGDKARLLPKCKHGFHVECIDMWFQSNSSCPLCRDPVGADIGIEPALGNPVRPLEAVSETGQQSKILDEGSSSSGSSLSRKRQRDMLAIEIPRRALEAASSPVTASRMPAEGIKSPALERLRRILSRGNLNGNCVGSTCSTPRGYDIEAGPATAIQSSSESASYS